MPPEFEFVVIAETDEWTDSLTASSLSSAEEHPSLILRWWLLFPRRGATVPSISSSIQSERSSPSIKSMEDPVVVVVVTVRVVLDVVSSRRSDDDGAVETDQSSWIAQWVADLKSSSSLADSIDTLMEAELPRTVRHFDLEWFVRADEKATTKKGFLVFFVFLLLFVLFFVFVFFVFVFVFFFSPPMGAYLPKTMRGDGKIWFVMVCWMGVLLVFFGVL